MAHAVSKSSVPSARGPRTCRAACRAPSSQASCNCSIRRSSGRLGCLRSSCMVQHPLVPRFQTCSLKDARTLALLMRHSLRARLGGRGLQSTSVCPGWCAELLAILSQVSVSKKTGTAQDHLGVGLATPGAVWDSWAYTHRIRTSASFAEGHENFFGCGYHPSLRACSEGMVPGWGSRVQSRSRRRRSTSDRVTSPRAICSHKCRWASRCGFHSAQGRRCALAAACRSAMTACASLSSSCIAAHCTMPHACDDGSLAGSDLQH